MKVETYLTDSAKLGGGETVKLGLNGWPDRMVLLPGGIAGFCELKRPGGRLSEIQAARLRRLRALGFEARCAEGFTEVDEFMEALRFNTLSRLRGGE